jgi:chromosome segregation ATPase
MSFFACGNNTANQERIDSLQTALEQRNADYQELDEYLTIISTGLDSIAMQESEIFNPSKESPIPNRDQIKQDLENFQQTLKNQRERIAQLEQKLKSGKGENKKLQAIVVSLKAQLTEKESQIAQLRDELNSKNITIGQMSERIGTMTRQAAVQEEVITSQNKMLQTQDDIINEGFVKIASKAELKQSGLLTGGFLKKSKVDYSQVDKRAFRSIDTRVVTEFEINSKNPKILTQVPSDSYTLEKNGDKTILRIIDPSRFWSVSKFLIIQI